MKNLNNTNGGAMAFLNRLFQIALMFALTSAPAFAQFQQQAQSKLSALQTVLLAVSGTTATIATLWVGNKMMFQQAKWPEVSQVAMGGLLISLAGVFGAWIVG
jgi:hypothetical protein